MDLFETVRDKLGCEYISDMRSCRAFLTDAKKVVASLDLEAYTARELADMAEYLYGKKMYGAEKDIIRFYVNSWGIMKQMYFGWPRKTAQLRYYSLPCECATRVG